MRGEDTQILGLPKINIYVAFSCANAHATMGLTTRRTACEFIIATSQRYANIPNSLVAETLSLKDVVCTTCQGGRMA